MCNKNSTSLSPPKTRTKTKTKSITMKKRKKQTKKNICSSISPSSSSSSSSLKSRRNKTKRKKPKYLSLRLQLSKTEKNKDQPKNSNNKKTPKQEQQQQHPQVVNLFAHHREIEHDMHEENNVALLFTSDGGATLNGLLEDESTTLTAATTTEEEEESLSVMRCPVMDQGLVRKAMRRKRNDEESEERWVSYSEVVEETKKEMMEEVNSTCVGFETTSFFGSLSLKLDHDGILNAWSDKGSLYVDGFDEAPQTVPDLFGGSILPNVILLIFISIFRFVSYLIHSEFDRITVSL